MRIENLRLWQWLIIGPVVGLLFSVVLIVQGPWFDTENLDTIDQSTFDWNALYDLKPPGGRTLDNEEGYIHEFHNGDAMLKNVVVHPPPTTDPSHRWWVTGKYFVALLGHKDPKDVKSPEVVDGEWRPFKYPCSTPYYPSFHSAQLVDTQRLAKELTDKEAALRAKTPPQRLTDDERKHLRTMEQEIGNDTRLQKAVGGPDSFENVGAFLQFANSKEPGRRLTYSVAWWEKKSALWSMPPLAGLLIIGLGGPLLVSGMQATGLAPLLQVREKKVRQPKAQPKSAATARPAATTAGVQIVTPPPQRPMTEQEKKEYGGVYYPVVKSTHKDTH